MKPMTKRRGGRPSRIEAERLEDKILDAAAALFFREGYGAVSIEIIAKHAQISKRTFYTRFENKAAIFTAVVHRVIQTIRPPQDATDRLFEGSNLEEILHRIAPIILRASLTPQSVALQRVVMAEGQRFPELAMIMNQQGARQEAINRISAILEKHAEAGRTHSDAAFAAEQFLAMLVSVPQRRAMGFGAALKDGDIDRWANATVDLFLKGF